ncbi:MAG TPA: thiazole synthase, partial [Spirochaetota bacterium]|nr:thiazole synthase [Spirochaetota bacterium]
MNKDPFYLGGVEFHSRLILGTGKYPSGEIMLKSIEASGCQMVTAALRRVDLDNPQDDILSRIDKNKIVVLPNTSGARNSKEAIKIAEISMASGLSE